MASSLALEGTELDPRHLFYKEAHSVVAELCKNGERFTKDDIKARMTVAPPSPSHWGNLPRQSWWRDMVQDSGRMAPSRNKLSRGHRIIVWEPKPREVD